MKLNIIDWIALILVIIGGLNWGLVGALGYDVVAMIFGAGIIATVVYSLVGLSALWLLVIAAKLQKKGGMPMGQM
jgi:hypothetical protein